MINPMSANPWVNPMRLPQPPVDMWLPAPQLVAPGLLMPNRFQGPVAANDNRFAQPPGFPQPFFNPAQMPANQNLPNSQQDAFVRTQPVQTSSVSTLTPAEISTPAVQRTPWKNNLKPMFHKNQAVVYALNIRTFGAEDKNGDGRISVSLGENGTFLNAIKNLDELKALGVNTIHMLPIQEPGEIKRFGEAGSVYAPKDYHQLNPQFDTPGNNLDVWQEAKIFIEEAHKRGIHVMVDVPSCASLDLAYARPDLIAKDAQGRTLTPTNWVDIVMFKNGPELVQYYAKFFDLMANKLGVDGFRVDVARARTTDFWKHFISKYPDKAWLAETYVEEDASPLRNIPRDVPEDLLKAGFDSIYGQFHIFHSMANAKEYMDYLVQNRSMFQRASQRGGNDKSFIGSFVTHDDMSLMEHGGVLQHLLVSGLMATQPWTNPYILDGFTTGYNHGIKAHNYFDIFNYTPRPRGKHPEVGQFLTRMLNLRRQYEPVLTQGQFIPIPVVGNDPNNQVIAFARHLNGKTLLIVANKDINARQSATLNIPGLNADQPLKNLAPEYGRGSQFKASTNQLQVDLGAGRFHVFEIDTPQIARQLKAY